MLRTVADKEIRDIVTSTKFAVAFGVCALLIIAAFYIGATHFKVSQEQYEASKAVNLRQMEGVTDWMQIQQHRIFLPPRPLGALVSGVSNDIGRTVEIVGRREITARDSKFTSCVARGRLTHGV